MLQIAIDYSNHFVSEKFSAKRNENDQPDSIKSAKLSFCSL